MSTTSRSQSSSPDILGPPGDAEYLISSPMKPFVGRQSFLSPANSTRRRTPAKRSRVSLSPAKSAHSIRFDDVVLPGSPTMKLDGRQRSLSPEKFPTDGNVSPWRIRVTLEATQDDENELQGSPTRKKMRQSTVTTKVPLKDDRSPLQEKTPRRRGRPRKSEVLALNGSPWPGSPGNTPGPKGETPQKGKRGRPRKGTPKPKAQEVPAVEDEPAPAPKPTETDLHFSPMDTAADGGDSGPQWTPMNFTADGLDSDSLGADDLPIANLRAPTPAAIQEAWDLTNTNNHDFGRASFGTPVIGLTEHHFLDNDENIHSTPSKMPSPTREITASSARSARPADGNSPSHTYPPTPTSSFGEEENLDAEVQTENRQEREAQNPQPESTEDPTNEHEEFDSIMESEGFTMISLDTLPSVKQRGLGSGARVGSENSLNRDSGRVGERLKRQLPGGIGELRSDSQSSARPSPVAVVSVQQPSDLALNQHVPTKRGTQGLGDAFSYPELPAASPQKGQTSFDTEPTPLYPTLADEEQVDEEDIAESIGEPLNVQEEELEEEEDEILDDEDEMDVVDPSPRIERSEPAQTRAISPLLQREQLWQMEREAVSRQAQDPRNEPRVIYIESDENTSRASAGNTKSVDDHVQSDDESDVDEQELADEQPMVDEAGEEPIEEESADQESVGEPETENFIEQEPVESYRASDAFVEAARFSRSDVTEQPTTRYPDQVPSGTYDGDDGSVDIWQQDSREEQFVPQELSTIDEEQEVGEDEAFDDIWQQEARDHSRLSERSDDRIPNPAEAAASAWRRIAGNSANQSNLSSSPAYVTMEHSDEKDHGPTYVRRLRDEEVDLSALLAEEDTPNRARYYNGTSTPRSMLNLQSGAQYSSINGSATKTDSSRKTGQRARLQPISQSPEMEPEVEHDSPVVLNEHPRSDSSSEEDEEIGSVPDVEVYEDESVQEDSVATPKQQGQPEGQPPTSTWFQRITSLTPRWLKAPAKSHDRSSEDGELDDQDDDASVQFAEEARENLEHVPSPKRSSESPRYFDELAGLPHYDRDERKPPYEEDEDEVSEVENPEEQYLDEESLSDGHIEDDNDAAVDLVEDDPDKLPEPRPLAASGYFSDDHYKALRRIYQTAKQYPEQFPYYDAPGRAKIIGDWIWTSDGRHGVPITEIQFAIIDRFVHGLSRADVKYGGSGQVEWTEADLHRRLISIIMGEQIREERKVKAARGASVDTWR